MNRVLHTGTKNASSWSLRAWLALHEANVEFQEHLVDIRRPQRFENLAKIAQFSAPGAVPVLVDGETVIFDSLAIMEYANELAGGLLLPSEAKARAHTRSLLAWQHAGLSNTCPRLSFESVFYPNQRVMSATEVAESERVYNVWESELSASTGPYLAGSLSLADLAFVPTVLRLTTHTPTLERWPLTQAWAARLIARPRVQEWLQAAKLLPPIYSQDYLDE